MELIGKRQIVEKALLERRFQERSSGFEETLEFLESLGLVKETGRSITPTKSLNNIENALGEQIDEFAEKIMIRALHSSTRYGREMRGVLELFRLDTGQAVLEARAVPASGDTGRDLLHEGGMLQLNHGTETYTIEGRFTSEFIEVRFGNGIAPEKLERIANANAEIGHLAELRVLEYERETVGAKDAKHVLHVAKKNASAGFDIASVRRERMSNSLQFRMIEVKAVSDVDWEFSWSRNERTVAAEGKEAYFLYLVPVTNGKPDLNKLEVLRDPLRQLEDLKRWKIEEGDWVVARKGNHG